MASAESISPHIAYFISPHGFGHGARACAVMGALGELDPAIEFDIFTTVPRWFFDQSLDAPFTYEPLLTDIGFVQKTPLVVDLPETVRRLDDFFPVDQNRIDSLAAGIKEKGCRIILCDISPLGILVAGKAGVPSILIENFTWDWLYEGYQEEMPQVGRHISYLKKLFERADFHIQTEPVCLSSNADLTTYPVSRKPRISRKEVRESLGISENRKMVMVTMGGTPEHFPFLGHLEKCQDVCFVVSGGSEQARSSENLILIPQHSDFFHPDLVWASDAVIGKAGYSTIAEIYYAGVPFGYIPRKGFRESKALESFIRKEMGAVTLDEEDFYKGDWLSLLPRLLELPPMKRKGHWGADQAARFIYNILTSAPLSRKGT
ncbi:MAG: hypothetical protein JRJ51_10120 [Deltaproteobacteria bacterium]|nr:hypothetical protein [Deltaproteobacteria bacterium]